MQNNHQKEHLYKILVIGDLGVGKTSIIKRYVHHNFSPNYRATIGVDFALKVLNWDQETVRLQLWDIAGTDRPPSEHRNTATRSFFPCRDLTGTECFKNVKLIVYLFIYLLVFIY